jgi:sigma-B regulation protein RsbU (phosphoserine phosphatase)
MLEQLVETKQDELQAEVEELRRQVAALQQEKTDLEILLETTTQLSTDIEGELKRENDAVQRELMIGRQIQADFLPELLPELPYWHLAARFQPARQVAGDFYDAFTLPNNRLGIVIADVCDKGVGPAIFMALTRSLIRVLAQQATSRLQFANHAVAVGDIPEDIVETLNAVTLANEYITTNHGRASMFATLFFGVIDTESGVVTYVNGGHDAPIHLGPNGIKGRLPLTGPAVGALPGVKYKMRQLKLDPGDAILAYSDGVSDAKNPLGELFGEKRLLALLEERQHDELGSAAALLDYVMNEISAHVAEAEPWDDITMLGVCFKCGEWFDKPVSL